MIKLNEVIDFFALDFLLRGSSDFQLHTIYRHVWHLVWDQKSGTFYQQNQKK